MCFVGYSRILIIVDISDSLNESSSQGRTALRSACQIDPGLRCFTLLEPTTALNPEPMDFVVTVRGDEVGDSLTECQAMEARASARHHTPDSAWLALPQLTVIA